MLQKEFLTFDLFYLDCQIELNRKITLMQTFRLTPQGCQQASGSGHWPVT